MREYFSVCGCWQLMKLDRLLNNWPAANCNRWIVTAVNPFTAKDHLLTVGPQYKEVWLGVHVCVCVYPKHFMNNTLHLLHHIGDYRKLNIPPLINQEVKFPQVKVCCYSCRLWLANDRRGNREESSAAPLWVPVCSNWWSTFFDEWTIYSSNTLKHPGV